MTRDEEMAEAGVQEGLVERKQDEVAPENGGLLLEAEPRGSVDGKVEGPDAVVVSEEPKDIGDDMEMLSTEAIESVTVEIGQSDAIHADRADENKGLKTDVNGAKEEQVGEETPKTSAAQVILDDADLEGTDEEQFQFRKEVETFYRENGFEFKVPKFYGKELDCLKLWKSVTGLGGYDKVTALKLWKHVGGAFKPPKTCTTISWTFRGFYEKALLEYEKHKVQSGELCFPPFTDSKSVENQLGDNQASGSGRVRRDAAARAMQGWHSRGLLGNSVVSEPNVKDKSSVAVTLYEKPTESNGVYKGKKSSNLDHITRGVHTSAKATKLHKDVDVTDVGPAADWVKINVRKTNDCFEVYALVPGLLREEVRVQSDPAGRLVISGEPEKLDNPWGVTPFKKVVNLSSRIDPLHTSAVVTLHGQLFVRAPFELSDA